MTGLRFDHDALPGRVLFGAGRLDELPAELERLGLQRALFVVARSQAALVERFEVIAAGVVGGVAQHVPIEEAEAARQVADETGADGLVALGGGSAVGLTKAVALTTGLPLVAVPTTYSGSEMTTIWGLNEGGRKTTGRDPAVLPRIVIYDPELSRSLPAAIAAPSGMNALAHAAEALWVEAATPLTTSVAEGAIHLLAPALRGIVADPGAPGPREQALAGAWLAGSAIAVTGTGIHHKTCHVLGGLGLPHAETHAVVLPYSAALITPDAPEAGARIARALGADDAVAGLLALSRALCVPGSLGELGLTAEQVDVAADRIAEAEPSYPREAVRELLDRARAGDALERG